MLRTGAVTLLHNESSRVVHAPCLILVPPSRKEKIELMGDNRFLSLPGLIWQETMEELAEAGLYFTRGSHQVEAGRGDCDYVSRCMEHCAGETSAESASGEYMMRSIAVHLICLFHSRLYIRLEDKSPWSMEDAMNFIQLHYDKQFTLEFFRRRCAMNTSSFSREFKSRSGYSLFEYINMVRVKKACRMLKQGESSILDISISLGYNNISFFNRYFKKIMGQTPGEFRRSC